MSSNAVVRARIDEQIKEEASVVLAAMGLTVSDALRMMLTRVAREQSLRPWHGARQRDVRCDATVSPGRACPDSFGGSGARISLD